MKDAKKILICLVLKCIYCFCLTESVAITKDSTKITNRLFMPALQMGYINHNLKNISEGLIIQTSIEYRTNNNFLFRVNYDDFSGRIFTKDENDNQYVAKVPLSELIGGIGYRLNFKRHHTFALVQTGFRFYELPEIENNNGILSINQSSRQIMPLRYTLGYEYEFLENIFFNLELFLGHFIKEKDYWSNDKPFFGGTVGLSTTLF